jgi:hypothetical protein
MQGGGQQGGPESGGGGAARPCFDKRVKKKRQSRKTEIFEKCFMLFVLLRE